MATITIDPVTRIEGHLRIQAEIDGSNIVTRASSSSIMMRGIELILKNRDPREAWAFAQRLCGVCTLVHGMASVRAVENALAYSVPPNAQLIRNLMIAAQFAHDHVMHFYHLHALDWVDVMSALNADPAATSQLQRSLSPWPNNSTAYFTDVKAKLQSLAQGGQAGPFANAYWGHPGYQLPAEVNLLAFAHYLEALAWQRNVAKLHAIFGGKNPHPTFVVGGVPCAISVDSSLRNYSGGKTAVNKAGLDTVKALIPEIQKFINEVYLPDTKAIAGYYKDWATRGEGVGNFLVFGEFPSATNPSSLTIPPAVILNRNLSSLQPVNLTDPAEIQEYIAYSWYNYTTGKTSALHPYSGQTTPSYSGPTPPFTVLNTQQPYSWIKAPRWKGKAMEVGPLARILVLYAKQHAQTRSLVDTTLAQLGLGFPAMYSTLGRTLARTLETKIIADMMQGWYDALINRIKANDFDTWNSAKWNPSTWPASCKGVGFSEAPRGALGHWVVIQSGKVANYQAVVPSTWNASPRDAAMQDGPYEAALRGHKLVNPAQPLELLRTIHSFDPCIGCAVHLVDPSGRELFEVKVQ